MPPSPCMDIHIMCELLDKDDVLKISSCDEANAKMKF